MKSSDISSAWNSDLLLHFPDQTTMTNRAAGTCGSWSCQPQNSDPLLLVLLPSPAEGHPTEDKLSCSADFAKNNLRTRCWSNVNSHIFRTCVRRSLTGRSSAYILRNLCQDNGLIRAALAWHSNMCWTVGSAQLTSPIEEFHNGAVTEVFCTLHHHFLQT